MGSRFVRSALAATRRDFQGFRAASPADRYWYLQRMRSVLFTRWIAPSFAEFGAGTVIWPPIALWGADRMAIGDNVHIASGSRIGVDAGARLEIGPSCWFWGETMIHAKESITIGRKVLVSRGVTIVDYQYHYDDPARAIIDQRRRTAPVRIGDGTWIGAGAVIGAGITIGSGAVIGAQAVVTSNVGDHEVVAGVPARPLR
jgi:acetyltransferase-like isoleucine patch superfamily enzyme